MSPAADAVMVPVPVVVAVKAETALPPLAVTDGPGLNIPERPVALNVMELVADVTVLPLESWIAAV